METQEKKIYYPDPMANWETKLSEAYNLAYARLMSNDWFQDGKITETSNYGTRRSWIINKRLLARGEQNEKKYKEHLSRQKGSLDFMNLDWRPINIAGKFCNVVSNGISEENYRLDIRAKDRHTLLRKKEQMEKHRNNMRTLPLLKKVKRDLGIDMIPKGFIPEDEEDLMLWSEIKDRPKIEIAEEILINYIKQVNNYDFIEERKKKDLVEIGITASRNWTDPVNGVSTEYVDPEFFIHSPVRNNNFKDAYYFGYIDEITIDQLATESHYTEKELRKIAKRFAGDNRNMNNYLTCDFNELLDIKIQILRYTFKTSKIDNWKLHKRKGETVKASSKDESYDPPERNDYGKLSIRKGTWISGTYIIDSSYVYGIKEEENIVRDERDNPIPPFVVRSTNIYKNVLHSFLDDIEPLVDQMQYTHLKIQHLQAELKPDLTVINQDALVDLNGTGDQKQMWDDTLNMLGVKGVVIEKVVDAGEYGTSNKQGARTASNAQGSALAALLNVWAHYYNTIRETSGVNPARDGSLPHDALLGVNRMAQLASNTATKHIVDASIDFDKRNSELISTRVHAIFRSKEPGAKEIQEMYKKAVGKENVEALEVMKDRHLHDFGFTVNMIPTKQELDSFKEDLSLFIQANGADIDTIAVKNEAEQIAKTNIKLATQYLFHQGKKMKKRRMEERMIEARNKSENDAQTAVAAKKAEAEAYNLKKQADLNYDAGLAKIEIAKEEALEQIKEPGKQRDFQRDVFLKQLEEASNFKKAEYMEDRKDKRTKIQATQQSRMIPERKSENPQAIDFEKEDLLSQIFDFQ
jgi:hypothetical protein